MQPRCPADPEIADLVATLGEVERGLARRDQDVACPPDLDVLELHALVDLTLERDAA